MTKILFQGDSITDCRRDKENLFEGNTGYALGTGYAFMVAGRMNLDFPGKYHYINKGISGNRIVDVYARIKSDIINIKPDVMSLLIGVNDVWHEVQQQNGVSAEKFEKIYDMLISEILEEVPDIKIILLEPFVLEGEVTAPDWQIFDKEVRKRAAATKKIAQKYHLKFVPLQSKFDEMVAIQPEPYWTMEGVHPMPCGHELIAREWIKAFNELVQKKEIAL